MPKKYEIEVGSDFGIEIIEVNDDDPVWEYLHMVWLYACDIEPLDHYDRTDGVVFTHRILRQCDMEVFSALCVLVGYLRAVDDLCYFPYDY